MPFKPTIEVKRPAGSRFSTHKQMNIAIRWGMGKLSSSLAAHQLLVSRESAYLRLAQGLRDAILCGRIEVLYDPAKEESQELVENIGKSLSMEFDKSVDNAIACFSAEGRCLIEELMSLVYFEEHEANDKTNKGKVREAFEARGWTKKHLRIKGKQVWCFVSPDYEVRLGRPIKL